MFEQMYGVSKVQVTCYLLMNGFSQIIIFNFVNVDHFTYSKTKWTVDSNINETKGVLHKPYGPVNLVKTIA